MKKLSQTAQTKVKGGAGISGAFLTGIAGIINGLSNGFATIIGTIVNSIHSFSDGPHAKAEFKFGNATMSYDDTKIVDLERELVKQGSHEHVLKIKPVVVETFHEHLDFQTMELLQHPIDEPSFEDIF